MKRFIGLIVVLTVISGIFGCGSELGKIKLIEKQGDWAKAQDALTKAIAKRPNNPQLHNELGYVYTKRGYFDLANGEYSKAIQIDPFYVEAYYNRGTLYFKTGKVDEAKVDFEKVISIDKNFHQAYNNLGLLNQMYFKKNDEALKNYQIAIDIDPENWIYHDNLRSLYVIMGNKKGAQEESDRAQILQAKTLGKK